MKYRDPESGKVFDAINDANRYYCDSRECIDCPLPASKNGFGVTCYNFCVKYPAKAARAMGYEVIEDADMEMKNTELKPSVSGFDSERTSHEADEPGGKTHGEGAECARTQPRICEVLGVEVGERFTFTVDEITVKCATIGADGVMYRLNPDGTVNNKIGGRMLCGAINHPECIVRRKRFTPQEIEDAKAIRRLCGVSDILQRSQRGNLLVYGKDGFPWWSINTDLFPSIAPGESYTLDEIIGEG